MENAGGGAARIALEMLQDAGLRARVVCVAGPGGNGGDALVVARHLAVAGADVEILAWTPQGQGATPVEASCNAEICAAMGLPRTDVDTESRAAGAVEALLRADLVVDGLFGSGLARPAAGIPARLIEAVNAARRTVLALDLPSGLDCDTGEPLGACVRAAVTATFLAPKLGFANPRAREFTGAVRIVPIGAPFDWPRPGRG